MTFLDRGVNGGDPDGAVPARPIDSLALRRTTSRVTPRSRMAAAATPSDPRINPSSRCSVPMKPLPSSCASSWARTNTCRDESVNRSNIGPTLPPGDGCPAANPRPPGTPPTFSSTLTTGVGGSCRRCRAGPSHRRAPDAAFGWAIHRRLPGHPHHGPTSGCDAHGASRISLEQPSQGVHNPRQTRKAASVPRHRCPRRRGQSGSGRDCLGRSQSFCHPDDGDGVDHRPVERSPGHAAGRCGGSSDHDPWTKRDVVDRYRPPVGHRRSHRCRSRGDRRASGDEFVWRLPIRGAHEEVRRHLRDRRAEFELRRDCDGRRLRRGTKR